jgi:hypothetical protein
LIQYCWTGRREEHTVGDLVPFNKNQEAGGEDAALERIKREVESRIDFYKRTRLPDPDPFDSQGVIQALDRMEPALQQQAKTEVLEQATREIRRIARRFG